VYAHLVSKLGAISRLDELNTGETPMFKSLAMSSLALALSLTAWLLPMRGEQATAQPVPLHVLVVEYDIVPAEIDKYLTAIKELGAASAKEPGFRQLVITTSQKDPNHVLLFELWDNAAAHTAHVTTDHFKRYQAATGNMIAKRDVRTFSSVAVLSP
jgi:autoinducer 2-degrading protein